MSKQHVAKQDRLIGETVPKWIVYGLLSLGVLASVSTAWMLLPTESLRDARMFLSSPHEGDSSKLPSPTEITMEHEPAAESSRADRMMQEETVQETVAATTEPRAAGESMESNAAVVSPSPTDPAVESPPATVEAKAAEKVTGTSVLAGAVDLRDCPPLFAVMFKIGDVRPLDSDLTEKIARLKDWLDAHPKAKIVVEGHASAVGPEELNVLLSHRRAKAVAKLLLTNAGISNNRVATRAFGDQIPLPGFSPESRENQRASLRLEGANGCSATVTEEDNR